MPGNFSRIFRASTGLRRTLRRSSSMPTDRAISAARRSLSARPARFISPDSGIARRTASGAAAMAAGSTPTRRSSARYTSARRPSSTRYAQLSHATTWNGSRTGGGSGGPNASRKRRNASGDERFGREPMRHSSIISRAMKNLLVAALLLAPALARADEGMWTFDRFPSAQVEARYGFAPDAAWLEHVRRASARTSDCSAGFVSPNGLVVTNHHCARECAEQLSTAAHNHVADGFYAREAKDEPRCPDEHIDQLVEITNVTERIGRATQGKTGGDLAAALRAEIGAVEKACQVDAKTRCQVVTLYRGGLHHLYRYR